MLNLQAIAVSLTFVALCFAGPGGRANATEHSVPLPTVRGSPLQPNALTKRRLLQIELPKDVWDTDIRATGDGMMFAQLDDRIVAIDADTGTVRWKSQHGDSVLNPAFVGLIAQSDEDRVAASRPRAGRLLANTASFGTIALDSRTGRQVWTSDASLAGAVGAWAVLYRRSVTAPLTIRVLRRTASRGQHIWLSAPLSTGGYTSADDLPTIIDDTLYVSFLYPEGYTGTVAFDWSSGRYRWGVGCSHVFFHDKNLLFMENSFPLNAETFNAFQLSAVDRQSGAIRWTARYAPDPAVNYTPHRTQPDLVYAKAAHVDAHWVWFKLFDTWYRYPLRPLSGRTQAQRLVGFDVIGFGPSGSMLIRSHDEVAYAAPAQDGLVLHSLPIGRNIPDLCGTVHGYSSA